VIKRPITLVGDGIENPWNARTLIDAAAMFGGACLFRDRARLASAWMQTMREQPAPTMISRDDLVQGYAPIILCDNMDGATDIYGFGPVTGPQPAVVVGNERRGLAHDLRPIAHQSVQIPMVSRQINCLNVAAAAAVALYYLSRGSGKVGQSLHPHKKRPELLLAGPADHLELGSAIRSAAAFGWDHILIEDRRCVWFGVDRVTRSEGRAAARRGRNAIRVIPAHQDDHYAFDNVCVLTARHSGLPLHRARLDLGPRQLIVIPDESALSLDAEAWARLGRKITVVSLELPSRTFVYHYRLIATIVLAEIARQVGRPLQPGVGRRKQRRPSYESVIEQVERAEGELIYLDDLELY